MINWNAVQAKDGNAMNGVKTKAMTMGSYHADLSKKGIRSPNKASRTASKRCKPVLIDPPPNGWSGEYLNKHKGGTCGKASIKLHTSHP